MINMINNKNSKRYAVSHHNDQPVFRSTPRPMLDDCLTNLNPDTQLT